MPWEADPSILFVQCFLLNKGKHLDHRVKLVGQEDDPAYRVEILMKYRT